MCLHVATTEGEVIIFDVANVQGNVATTEGEVIIFEDHLLGNQHNI